MWTLDWADGAWWLYGVDASYTTNTNACSVTATIDKIRRVQHGVHGWVDVESVRVDVVQRVPGVVMMLGVVEWDEGDVAFVEHWRDAVLEMGWCMRVLMYRVWRRESERVQAGPGDGIERDVWWLEAGVVEEGDVVDVGRGWGHGYRHGYGCVAESGSEIGEGLFRGDYSVVVEVGMRRGDVAVWIGFYLFTF